MRLTTMRQHRLTAVPLVGYTAPPVKIQSTARRMEAVPVLLLDVCTYVLRTYDGLPHLPAVRTPPSARMPRISCA